MNQHTPSPVSNRQTPLAKFIAKRLDELAGVKSQREVAREVGFRSLNMVNLIKSGENKLPLDRVPAFAKALQVDPAHLFRLALSELMNGYSVAALKEVFGTTVTANEAAILEAIREASDNTDPALSDRLHQAIQSAFN